MPTLPAPVLLSVVQQGDQAVFTFEPYTFPGDVNGGFGNAQGFISPDDPNGFHVIGAFMYESDLAAGTFSAPLESGHTGPVVCQIFAGGHTALGMPGDEQLLARSNTVELGAAPVAAPLAATAKHGKGKGHG